MMDIAENKPGQPHRWVREIEAWACGQLVQWRYDLSGIPDHLELKPEFSEWRDCDYPSRGEPNWFGTGMEFRIAPVK